MDPLKDRTTLVPPPPSARIFEPSRDPLDTPLRTAGGALMGWWRAVTLDALIVGVMWFMGLELLHVPLAPLWAVLGALFQFIPNFGPMLSVIGPALSVLFQESGDMNSLWFVLGLYGIIMVLDGLVIQPYVLHRTTRVPWWASLLGPIVLGIIIPFWGVLIAPPLLAVIYAFRKPRVKA
jgi:predicted PurR-regulated permease PerM